MCSPNIYLWSLVSIKLNFKLKLNHTNFNVTFRLFCSLAGGATVVLLLWVVSFSTVRSLGSWCFFSFSFVASRSLLQVLLLSLLAGGAAFLLLLCAVLFRPSFFGSGAAGRCCLPLLFLWNAGASPSPFSGGTARHHPSVERRESTHTKTEEEKEAPPPVERQVAPSTWRVGKTAPPIPTKGGEHQHPQGDDYRKGQIQ